MKPSKKPVYVLLADDDPGDQDKMKTALRGTAADLKVELVANGMQLLDYLVKNAGGRKKLPDLIITDLYMPFAGGLHVLKQIRRQNALRHIPIYVFSANNDITIRSRVLENGATEFHQKPGDAGTLRTIVSGIVERWQAASPVAEA